MMQLAWGVVLVLGLAGCAGQFGGPMRVGELHVESVPPGLPMYVLTREEAVRLFGSEQGAFARPGSNELQAGLVHRSRAAANIALTHREGTYVVVVLCPSRYMVAPFGVVAGRENKVQVRCA